MTRTFIFFYFVLFVQVSYAQKILFGSVRDYLTYAPLNDTLTTVTLMGIDSTIIARANGIYDKDYRTGKITKTRFYFSLEKEGIYILRCESRGYHTLTKKLNIKFYNREDEIDCGEFTLKRSGRMDETTHILGDVTVTATKLKFYFDNDTIVYNADAFITQDGFMLSNILNKMPGITIDQNGEIFANGKKVESMLLNGKDFFNEDRQTLIENLPAFMVKSVRVYNKEKDSITTNDNGNDFDYAVMDVRLKPDYHTFFLGNFDVAYGTHNHYYSRALAMRVNDNSRWSAFAGLNDINRNEELTKDAQFKNIDNGNGEKDFYNAGINYNIEERQGKYTANGSLRIQGSKELLTQQSNGQMFYNSGDIYTQTWNSNKVRNLSFQTNHVISLFKGTPWKIDITPSLIFIKSKRNTEQLYGTFNRNVTNLLGEFWQDSLRSIQLGDIMRLYGINRMVSSSRENENMSQGKVDISKIINIPHCNDDLTLTSSFRYTENKETPITQRLTTYMLHNVSSSDQWINLYQWRTQSEWNAHTAAKYTLRLVSDMAIFGELKYERIDVTKRDYYYNLHNLVNFGTGSNYSLEQLFSSSNLESVLDSRNTYEYREQANKGVFTLGWRLSKEKYNLNIDIPFIGLHKHLNYNQKGYNNNFGKSMKAMDVNLSFFTWQSKQTGFDYSFSYALSHSMPSMFDMTERINDTNPLLVLKGNPTLKNTINHKFNANINWRPKPMDRHSLVLGFNTDQNKITSGLSYNKLTGAYTFMPVNVNGCWWASTSLTNSLYLDRSYTQKIEINTSFDVNKSVEVSTVDNYIGSGRNVVTYQRIKEMVSYQFTSKNTKFRGVITPYIIFTHSRSQMMEFNNFDQWLFGAEVALYYELPWSVRLSSNLRSISRRGYLDNSMNDDELIWNINLTKSFGKYLTINFEGIDLLGQLRNTVSYVTAQGRNEIRTNHLNQYAMIHLVWTFNRKGRIK